MAAESSQDPDILDASHAPADVTPDRQRPRRMSRRRFLTLAGGVSASLVTAAVVGEQFGERRVGPASAEAAPNAEYLERARTAQANADKLRGVINGTNSTGAGDQPAVPVTTLNGRLYVKDGDSGRTQYIDYPIDLSVRAGTLGDRVPQISVTDAALANSLAFVGEQVDRQSAVGINVRPFDPVTMHFKPYDGPGRVTFDVNTQVVPNTEGTLVQAIATGINSHPDQAIPPGAHLAVMQYEAS
jgi:hypothetical protein